MPSDDDTAGPRLVVLRTKGFETIPVSGLEIGVTYWPTNSLSKFRTDSDGYVELPPEAEQIRVRSLDPAYLIAEGHRPRSIIKDGTLILYATDGCLLDLRAYAPLEFGGQIDVRATYDNPGSSVTVEPFLFEDSLECGRDCRLSVPVITTPLRVYIYRHAQIIWSGVFSTWLELQLLSSITPSSHISDTYTSNCPFFGASGKWAIIRNDIVSQLRHRDVREFVAFDKGSGETCLLVFNRSEVGSFTSAVPQAFLAFALEMDTGHLVGDGIPWSRDLMLFVPREDR